MKPGCFREHIEMLGFGSPGPACSFQEALHCIPHASNTEKFLRRNKADENYHIRMAPRLQARARQPKMLNFNKTPDVTPVYVSDSNGVLSYFET